MRMTRETMPIVSYAGYGSAKAALRWATDLDPTLAYRGESAPWALNASKGMFGEQILERGIPSGILERARPGLMAITPHRMAGKGIDALFVKVGRDGTMRDLMVAEAKFGSSRRIHTSTGQQMSYQWVRPRLLSTAREYSRAASALREGGVRTANPAGRRVLWVPLGNRKNVGVWCDGSGLRCNAPVNPVRLRQQLLRIGQKLRAAAFDGSYRARLLKVSVDGRQFNLAMQRLDIQTGRSVGRAHCISGPWQKLSKQTRTLLNRCVRVFVKHISREGDVDALCRAIRRNPELLLNLRTEPSSRWLVGVDAGMARVALGAGAIAVLFSLARSAWSGNVSLHQALKEGALTGVSAATSYFTFAQVRSCLVTRAGREIARAVPLRAVNGSVIAGPAGLAAGVGAGIVLAVGAYVLGLADARQARVMGTASVAGVVASALVVDGAFGLATAFGTASTGVAIGSLSGAASNSAALAYIGSFASGGMAAGSALLTGGAALVGLAAVAGVHAAVAKLDRIERQRLVEARLELAERSLG